MQSIFRRTLEVLFAASLTAASMATLAEDVGTSQADLPSYTGAFSIENETGALIRYEFRWGSNHSWKTMALASGRIETHTYPLGADPNRKVPTPYVRFDRIGGDRGVTFQEYEMEFRAIGYAGFGPAENRTRPKAYVFRYAANGRDLDLKAKR
jgi:hypothetical protein